jgi:hypothetical protein
MECPPCTILGEIDIFEALLADQIANVAYLPERMMSLRHWLFDESMHS